MKSIQLVIIDILRHAWVSYLKHNATFYKICITRCDKQVQHINIDTFCFISEGEPLQCKKIRIKYKSKKKPKNPEHNVNIQMLVVV
jgi:hypothetical protein